MKNINDVAVIIFARLNSQRIPKKMIRPFAGTTLLDILLAKLTLSKIIPKQNIYLFAHEAELVDIAKKHAISLLPRSAESANAESDLKVIHEWHDKVDYTYVVSINACIPFLTSNTIDRFVAHYLQTKHEGLFGVIKRKNYFWDSSLQLMTSCPEEKQAPNTKTATEVFEAAHSLYASKIEWIKDGVWLGSFCKPNDPELFVIDEKESFDIDYHWQFEFAEAVYRQYVLSDKKAWRRE